jgi:hypothetical protein
MPLGKKAFRGIQISNPEDTPGTAEAAVEILYGTVTQTYTDKVFHMPEQDRSTLAKNVETPFQVSDEIELEMEGEIYDRLAVYMFNNAVRGNVTPTQPDAINEPLHYLWTLEPSLTGTCNTPDETDGIDTFTLEFGDNVQFYETEYLFTTQIEITGEPNEPCTFTWTMNGRQVTESTKTAALTELAAAYFPFNLAKFYIDTSYANMGTTQVTGMLRAFTWTLETMFTARFAADGNFHFTGLNEDKKTVQLELTYYRDDTNSEAEKDKFEAQTTSFLRIELNGETEMDVGESNPPYIRFDTAAKYTEWPTTEDEDGMAVVTVNAEGFLDSTSSKMFSVLIGTTMDAYPV